MLIKHHVDVCSYIYLHYQNLVFYKLFYNPHKIMKFVILIFTLIVFPEDIWNSPVKSELDSDDFLQKFNCSVKLFQRCAFENLHLNRTHPYFQTHGDRSSSRIIAVDLGGNQNKTQGSKLEILTNDICNAFSNLKEIWSIYLDLHEIQQDAFESCTRLEELYLYGNNLKNLDKSVFKKNSNLKEIWLNDNQLETINVEIFSHTPILEKLSLAENFLTEINMEEFPKLAHLSNLYLHSNQLSNIDEEKLVEKFPNLQGIRLCPNDFSSTRLNELKLFFNLKHIMTDLDRCVGS